MTKTGIPWLAKILFLEQLPNQRAGIESFLEGLRDTNAAIVAKALGIDDLAKVGPGDAPQLMDRLKDKKDSEEFWAMSAGTFAQLALQAREAGDIDQAIWATACAERCRTMLLFKQNLEQVVTMGHSAARIIQVLRIWDEHRTNADEEFWQIRLREHAYVLAQAFASVAILIKDKAYVGGMSLDGKGSRFVDFLYKRWSRQSKPPLWRSRHLRRSYQVGSTEAVSTPLLLNSLERLSKRESTVRG